MTGWPEVPRVRRSGLVRRPGTPLPRGRPRTVDATITTKGLPKLENRTIIAERILEFNAYLSTVQLELPPGWNLANPFSGPHQERVFEVTSSFYRRFYNDTSPRRLILGSSPARQGTAVTGVPFADAKLLEGESGTKIEGYKVGRGSSGFLDEVIAAYGGHEPFYADFVMNFVCPLGIIRTNDKGREVNANYYESRELLESVREFVVEAVRRQTEIGIDTSVCYCIGSGGNYKVLSEINRRQRFFDRIVPLAHPRYIAQYNPTRTGEFVDKYLQALRR